MGARQTRCPRNVSSCALALLATVLALPASSGSAGETLVASDFKNLDLTALPQGWELKGAADISLADDPLKGKVLRICHQGGGTPTLEIKLDIAKARGCKIVASVWAKCPASYKAPPDKPGAPQLYLMCRNKNGASNGVTAYIKSGGADWQQLVARCDVTADTEAATVSLRVVEAATDVFFDALLVQIEDAPPGPAAQTPAAPAPLGQAAPLPTTASPAVPAPVPAGAAAGAPQKTIENDGILFSPEIAAVLSAARKKSAAEHSYVVLGPGAPLKDLEAKLAGKWTCIAATREFSGALAAPEHMVSALPAFVVAQKPEVVILAGAAGPARKLAYYERCDWEDLARICLRFGAVPVIFLPLPGALDDLRDQMVQAAQAAKCAVVDPKTAALGPQRLRQALDLLDRHVFERASETEATKAEASKKPTEE